MNPLLQSFLSSVFRWLLTGVGAWFVQKGILDQAQATEMIAGAVLALVALVWSLYSKYRAKLEENTRAAMPKGTTLLEAKESIAGGMMAKASTQADETPRLALRGSSGVPKGIAGLLLAVLLVGPVAGCAGVSPRARVVQTHQSIQTLLASVDDAERVLCFGGVMLPADPTTCTTPTAAKVGLTSDRHRAIHKALATAYDAQIALVAVIAAWVPGQPLDTSALLTAAAAVDAEVRRLNLGLPELEPLIRQVVAWVTEVKALGAK